ncbi:MAG: glutamate-5-semialdehyde dehydrogenase [Alphaproteobacteria bacterium]|nr:MAG: glutamate-5-semialdehyde dehydrogenase [Alphaproteobacteria bacterium]
MSKVHAITQSPEDIVSALGVEAKKAAATLVQTPTDTINNVLTGLADALRQNAEAILSENQKDLDSARERGLTDAMIDRLALDEQRIEGMAQSVETVRQLDDPTEKILWEENRPNGLKIQRISCPIGVFGMIYESRPNVTIDASILCLKSHNAVILRGGSESLHSSLALHKIIQNTLESFNLPKACVSMIPTSDRAAVGAMLRAAEYIDVMIPRGGHGLIERVMNEARMPVFGHLDGLCHVYVDKSADTDIAKNVTLNAKMRRTGICGAMETLLLDENLDKTIATDILANIIDSGCDIVGDTTVQTLDNRIKPATSDDWTTEYLDAKLSCRMVSNIEEAVTHINEKGSHHTDCIIAQDNRAVAYFQKNVDSGIVMHNASTQFADGGEFGMGAEIGIATGKMHARGPVGLQQLCTYKYLVHGTGQTRA